ncbi:MAG: MBOAT family O-acyltransferase [bacterium]|nr:MBOAT family O-acyltransferase [bacterium]
MVFSSIEFVFYFLPAFLLVYFAVPQTYRNAVLFGASLLFYFYGVKDQPFYMVLIVLSILVNFFVAKRMSHSHWTRNRRRWLKLGLFYNLGWLFVFKYLDFLSENINAVSRLLGGGELLPYMNLVLPIGISFYTFQISSYLIDVFRKQIKAEQSVLTLGTYLVMFPQLIAGPIVLYSSVQKELHKRRHSFSRFENGMREFTIGLGLKVLIANQVGNLWSQVNAIGYESISTPLAWLGLFAYSLQIYFDFYGYSLMAKGLGWMMGFRFPDNFNNPYLSVSMTDFWRRWHMTLGSWFREYVYIPLGGNRRHLARNLFVVWMLTGLWHGASWNFVLWGFLIFVLIFLEKKKLGAVLETYRPLGHLYMLFVIPLSWLLFAVTDLRQIGLYLQRLFPFFSGSTVPIFAQDYIKYGRMYLLSLLAGLLCCTGWPRKCYQRYKYHFLTAVALLAIFWGCVYCMYLGLDDPFLYFRF